VDYLLPERIYGGTQDNNTIRTLTGAVDDWQPILGGDGMYTLVDYTNSNVIYAEYQWGNLYRSDNGGYDMDYIGWMWEGNAKTGRPLWRCIPKIRLSSISGHTEFGRHSIKEQLDAYQRRPDPGN